MKEILTMYFYLITWGINDETVLVLESDILR